MRRGRAFIDVSLVRVPAAKAPQRVGACCEGDILREALRRFRRDCFCPDIELGSRCLPAANFERGSCADSFFLLWLTC